MNRMKKICAGLLLLAFCFSALPQAMAKDDKEAEVRAALAKFVQAFDNLDWETFRASFADNATVFHPRQFARRVEGRAGVEETFKQVFVRIKGDKTSPPYMDLQPKDLQIQLAGDQVAIATFHLDDRPGFLNRRTIVLQKIERTWKIIHIHASEVADTH
jgi:ketosteroid isomerase-like protein